MKQISNELILAYGLVMWVLATANLFFEFAISENGRVLPQKALKIFVGSGLALGFVTLIIWGVIQ